MRCKGPDKGTEEGGRDFSARGFGMKNAAVHRTLLLDACVVDVAPATVGLSLCKMAASDGIIGPMLDQTGRVVALSHGCVDSLLDSDHVLNCQPRTMPLEREFRFWSSTQPCPPVPRK